MIFADIFKDYERPSKEIKYIYSFDNENRLRRIKASTLNGVGFVHRVSGVVMTNMGFATGPFYRCSFYKSKKDLLNSIGNGEGI